MRKEEQASGIECEETELDRALEEICEKEQASNRDRASSTQTKADKAAAEEHRLKAVERLGETAKRQADTEGKEASKRKKSGRSGSETVENLRDKFCAEAEFKKQELALKQKEQENREAHQKAMIEQQKMIQQQHQDMLKVVQDQQQQQQQQVQSFQMLFLQQQQQQVQSFQMLFLQQQQQQVQSFQMPFLQQQQQQSKIMMSLLENATTKKN